MTGTVMTRRTFVASRDLDFFSVASLSKQIGHAPRRWPIALLKELVDNALDATESVGVHPQINVVIDESEINVTDNGAGLPDFVIEKAADFSVRVSDKSAYVSPTRGMQGNALKTIFAAGCVLGEGAGVIRIDSLEKHRTIEVRIDSIDQRPRIEIAEEPGFVKNGTSVSMDSACLIGSALLPSFYKSARELLARYSALNPHAVFRLRGAGDPETFEARKPSWSR